MQTVANEANCIMNELHALKQMEKKVTDLHNIAKWCFDWIP